MWGLGGLAELPPSGHRDYDGASLPGPWRGVHPPPFLRAGGELGARSFGALRGSKRARARAGELERF